MPSEEAPGGAYLAVAVASELRDEADVVIADLDHLLTDVVLGTDAALGTGPPGQESSLLRGQAAGRTWLSGSAP